MSDAIADKLTNLEDEKEKSDGRILDLESKLATKEKEMTALKKKVKSEQETSTKLHTRCDDLEQYGRRNNLRIFGIRESKDEDTDQHVIKVAERLGVKLSANEIEPLTQNRKTQP